MRRLLFIATLLVTNILIAMDNQLTKEATPGQQSLIEQLPIELQTQILENLTTADGHYNFQKMVNAGNNIRRLANVNKHFYMLINNPENTQILLRLLAKNYIIDPVDEKRPMQTLLVAAAAALNTQGAKNWFKQLNLDLPTAFSLVTNALQIGAPAVAQFIIANSEVLSLNPGLLMYNAITNGQLVIVKEILKKNPHLLNERAMTGFPLTVALLLNQPAIFDFLLTQPNVDINAVDSVGNTVLIYAIQKNDPDAVEKILQNSTVQVNKKNKAGSTPLAIAMRCNKTFSYCDDMANYGKVKKIIELLENKGGLLKAP